MHRHAEQRLLPYTREQVYSVVSDVERYPEFVPGWRAVRIVRRAGEMAHVEQAIGLGAFRFQFESRAIFIAPSSVSIETDKGPFRAFALNWRFEPEALLACRVHFELAFQMRSLLFDRAAAATFGDVARQVVNAFEERIRRLHGPAAPR
jgi:coenzyme Q-binding protein COQ10